MIAYAALTPMTKLSKVEAEELGSGLYKVSASVKNLGFLPTNITEQGKKAKIAKPATIEVDLGEGAKLIMGKEKLELGHIEGRSDKLPGRFYTPLGPKKDPPGRYFGGMWGQGGDSSLKAAEGLIGIDKDTKIVITAFSEKGGTDRREMTLEA